jgi:transposase InsO family protein
MPKTPMDELRALSSTLGSPGFQALWTAVRRRGLRVTKEQVRTLIRRQGERQVFTAIQPSKGKSAAEEPFARLQMDLIDMRNQVNIAEDKKMKFGLIVVDVFTRRLAARAMPNKTPEETVRHLRDILDTFPKKPAVISSDQGLEFSGPVEQELKDRGIGHWTKSTLDKNALAVVDRIIQALKKTIARMMAKKPGGHG